MRSLNFGGLGSTIIVLDTGDLSITTYQGRRLLMEDGNGENFPWFVFEHIKTKKINFRLDPPIKEVFKGKLLRNSNNNSSKNFEYVDFSSLKPSIKGLYFGAKWVCFIFVRNLKIIILAFCLLF